MLYDLTKKNLLCIVLIILLILLTISAISYKNFHDLKRDIPPIVCNNNFKTVSRLSTFRLYFLVLLIIITLVCIYKSKD